MKLYIVVIEDVDPKKKEDWDRYSRERHKKPHGVGPRNIVLVTNDPTRGNKRWKAPGKKGK